jgi:acetyl esterase/lipase
VRGCLFLGERDERYRQRAEVVAAALSGAGVRLRSTVVPGLGHDYPEPFETSIREALSFVLGPGSSISS